MKLIKKQRKNYLELVEY